jgi:predicted dehydrogenase
LPWIWEHPRAELIAVCDRNPERAALARQRWGAQFAFSDSAETLSRDDIDAVCICTPPSSHRDLAVQAARHGKHILLEKPMATSVAQCHEILEAARECGVILMLGHEKRFNVACQKIRQAIQKGTLGRIFHLAVHWGSSVKLDPQRLIPEGYRDSYEWRWKDAAVGGGILHDHLPHYVDLWRWWTGSEVATVCTEALNVTRDYLGNAGLGVWEDFGSVLMRFKDGTVGVFTTGTVGRGLSPILHAGSGIGEWSEFGYLFGTRGQLTFDLPFWDSPELGRVLVWSLEDKRPDDRFCYILELRVVGI